MTLGNDFENFPFQRTTSLALNRKLLVLVPFEFFFLHRCFCDFSGEIFCCFPSLAFYLDVFSEDLSLFKETMWGIVILGEMFLSAAFLYLFGMARAPQLILLITVLDFLMLTSTFSPCSPGIHWIWVWVISGTALPFLCVILCVF